MKRTLTFLVTWLVALALSLPSVNEAQLLVPLGGTGTSTVFPSGSIVIAATNGIYTANPSLTFTATGPTIGLSVSGGLTVSEPVNDSFQSSLFLTPSTSLTTMTNAAFFYSFVNGAWNYNTDRIVHAGTRGNIGGYEFNITTDQATADFTEGSHAFGTTMHTKRNVPITTLAADMEIDAGASPTTRSSNGVNIGFVNNATGYTNISGFVASLSGTGGISGSNQGDTAFLAIGRWLRAIDTQGGIAINLSALRFATSNITPPIASTEYYLDGSSTGQFDIMGGGSNNLIRFFSAPATGRAGTFRFYDNSAQLNERFRIDAASGKITMPAIAAVSGTRYLCIDTAGLVSSSASACSGT